MGRAYLAICVAVGFIVDIDIMGKYLGLIGLPQLASLLQDYSIRGLMVKCGRHDDVQDHHLITYFDRLETASCSHATESTVRSGSKHEGNMGDRGRLFCDGRRGPRTSQGLRQERRARERGQDHGRWPRTLALATNRCHRPGRAES